MDRQVADIINESIAIPVPPASIACRDARKISLSEIFCALYITEKQASLSTFSLQSVYYNNYARAFGRASGCIACGQCEHACPQHIDIINQLKKSPPYLRNKHGQVCGPGSLSGVPGPLYFRENCSGIV